MDFASIRYVTICWHGRRPCKWFHFYHFLHRLGLWLLIAEFNCRTSSISENSYLKKYLMVTSDQFLMVTFCSLFISFWFRSYFLVGMCSFLLYFNILLSDRPPSTEYGFLPQINTQNLFKNWILNKKPVTLFRRCVPTGTEWLKIFFNLCKGKKLYNFNFSTIG